MTVREREPFRIAHLSDLHLTAADDAARSEPKLFGRLRGMNAAFRTILQAREIQSAHLLLVTGDVTDRGDLESWQVFWEAIDGAGLKARTWVVPGNHDACCLGARVPKKYAARDLERLRRGLRLKVGHPTDFPWAHVPDERVAIFAVNSNNLGNVWGATNAMGEIGHRQLARLARLLRKHQGIPAKIIALHHSPNIPGEEVAARRGLKRLGWVEKKLHQIDRAQRAALRLVGIAQGVRLIVHGHLHRKEDRSVEGIRIVGVPASTEPVVIAGRGRRYQFALYTVRGAKDRAHLSWPTAALEKDAG